MERLARDGRFGLAVRQRSGQGDGYGRDLIKRALPYQLGVRTT